MHYFKRYPDLHRKSLLNFENTSYCMTEHDRRETKLYELIRSVELVCTVVTTALGRQTVHFRYSQPTSGKESGQDRILDARHTFYPVDSSLYVQSIPLKLVARNQHSHSFRETCHAIEAEQMSCGLWGRFGSLN